MAELLTDLITVKQAARRVGKTPAALYVAIDKGWLKAQQRFGIWLVSEADLRDYRPPRRGRPNEPPSPKLRTDISQSELARELGVSRQRVHQMLNKEAHNARVVVGQALKSGKLVKPSNCERCGTSKRRLEAHHSDYAKKLDVVWLCPPCHSLVHPHANTTNGNKKSTSRKET